MGLVAAIGERVQVQGYALAGVGVHHAEDAGSVRAAWDALGGDVTVVILTPAAATVLEAAGLTGDGAAAVWPATVVIPA